MRVAGIPLGVLKKTDLATLLNLRFEGSEGSQVFTDSSSYNRAVTVLSGTPIISTTSPLSGVSSLFLGTNGTISTPNFITPAGNTYIRTIEFRIQISLTDIANNESQGVFAKGFSSSFFADYSHQCILTRNASGNGGVLYLYWYIPVVAQVFCYLAIPIADISANNHIAFTQRTNGIYAAYLNGVLAAASGFVQSYQTNTYAINIGVSVYNWATASQTNKFKGRLDNFKLSNIDRYPNNFTPPV